MYIYVYIYVIETQCTIYLPVTYLILFIIYGGSTHIYTHIFIYAHMRMHEFYMYIYIWDRVELYARPHFVHT